MQPPDQIAPDEIPKAGRGLLPYCVIFLAALAVTAPAILGPVRTNDSFWIDWVWLDQFAKELAKGNLYPRWLPLSHGGLGSPVFYYYPPLAFYAGSVFVLAGFSTYAAVIATFCACFFISGVAMYRWLKPHGAAPLFGALNFILAPYHVYNFYTRGALAESLATAFLPFVMIGVRKLASSERGGFTVTALGYAALILSHLPLALLASVFLIGPYALFRAARTPARLIAIACALGIGIGLAGAYLVPAFQLEPYRDSAKLWHRAVLEPSSWSFWNANFRTSPSYLSIVAIGLATAIPLVALAILHRSRWALFGLLCVALAIGIVPAIWSLPLLKSVQFPFRLLPIAEFALVTALAAPAVRPSLRWLTAAVLLMVTIPIVRSASPPVVPMAELRRFHPEVPENLPPGERPYSWPSRWALQVAETHRQPLFVNGTTIAPAFYYPAWQVRCNGESVPTFSDPTTKLLTYRGPPACERSIALTRPERTGWAISLLALLGLVGFSVSPWRRRAGPQG